MDWSGPVAVELPGPPERPPRSEPPASAHKGDDMPKVIPLSTAPPPEPTLTWAQIERAPMWRRVLTADPDTVPDDVRRAAGADSETDTPEEREYRLLNTVNRSWAVEHLGVSREQVRAEWPSMRRRLARQLEVANTEQEVFTELSLRAQAEPQRQEARRLYEEAYLQALDGETESPVESAPAAGAEPEEAWRADIQTLARERALQDREECRPHMDSLLQAMQAFADVESGTRGRLTVLWHAPELLEAVDDLAALDDRQRSVLYRMLRPELKKRGVEERTLGVAEAMVRNLNRGGVNMGYGIAQGIGNMLVSQIDNLADMTDSAALREFSDKQDKRLRVIEELRNVAHQVAIPIRLEEDSSFIDQLLVDAAGTVPGAAMAFGGPLGLSVLAVSSAGESVAAARQRAPQGDRRLQMAAGCLAGGVQAAIFKGMTALGRRMFDRVIRSFSASVGKGFSGYMAALAKSAYWFTQENVNMLLASRSAQAAELGIQEFAALASDTASNIDWEAFGDNLLDVELNMREAAMNLPFILIAGGRAAWHHFRQPRAILGDGKILDDWGVEPTLRERIMKAPDISTQGSLLEQGLRGSKRWAMFPPEWISGYLGRCLRLLHFDDLKLFDNEHNVRSFLHLPPLRHQVTSLMDSRRAPQTLPPPEETPGLHPHFASRKITDGEKYLRLVRMMYDWYRKSGCADEASAVIPGNPKKRLKFLLPSTRVPSLIPELQQNGLFSPVAERARRGYLAECFSELEQLSYRFLLNAHTVDKLMRLDLSSRELNTMIDNSRMKYLRMVTHEIMRGLRSGDYSQLAERINGFFYRFYGGQRVRLAREKWITSVPLRVFRDLHLPETATDRNMAHYPDELTEQLSINRSTEALVKRVCEILPHMEDFQSYISAGYSPRQCYEMILKHELGEQILDGAYREDPDFLPQTSEASQEEERREYSARNSARFELARQLSDLQLEEVATPDGGKQWRVRRPDGSTTRWKDTREEAINTFSHEYAMRTNVPFGTNQYGKFVREHLMTGGMQFIGALTRSRRGYSGDEALCLLALDDMQKLWMTDASMMPLGLQLGSRFRFNRVPTAYRGVEGMVYRMRGTDSDFYMLDRFRNASPLNLIIARARVYWMRMLNSGWVEPKAVGDFLLEHEAITPSRLSFLLSRGRPFRTYVKKSTWEKMSNKARRKYRLERIRNRYIVDREAMVRGLSDHMAKLSGLIYVANMNRLRTPVSLREWVASSAYREGVKNYRRPTQLAKKFFDQIRAKKDSLSLVRWCNEQATDFLQENAAKIESLRAQSQDAESPLSQAPLYQMTMEMWEPSPEMRREQCWSYLLCGETAFRNLDQRYWNVLRSPMKGWNHLDHESREMVRADFEEVCRKYPVPRDDGGFDSDFDACIQNLQQVLQQYPQLRDYSPGVSDPDEILRLELGTPPSPADPMEYLDDGAERVALSDRPSVQPGGRYVPSTLPPEMADNPRVLPALHFLKAWREYCTSMPTVRDDGIWWQNRRYGGESGARPTGVPETWHVSRPLQGLMQLLDKIAEQYGDKPFEQFGLRIAPLEEGIEEEMFRNMTVYRSNVTPEVQVRLMPGAMVSGKLQRRLPYVVYTICGVPIIERGYWRPAKGEAAMYRNLVGFACHASRSDYDEKMLKGKEFMDYVLDELLYRCQSPENLEAGRLADMSNCELAMHLGQDSNFSESMLNVQPGEMVPAELLAAKLLRELLDYEYGTEPKQAEAELLKLGKLLTDNPSWVEALRDMLRDNGINFSDIRSWDEEIRTIIRDSRALQPVDRTSLPASVEEWETLREIRRQNMPEEVPEEEAEADELSTEEQQLTPASDDDE